MHLTNSFLVLSNYSWEYPYIIQISIYSQQLKEYIYINIQHYYTTMNY